MRLFIDTGSVVAAKLGCEVATVPAKVLRQMLAHPLTTPGIARFEEDRRSRPESAEWLAELVAGHSVGVDR
jgi:transaldolase